MSQPERIKPIIKRTMRKLKLKAPIAKEWDEQRTVMDWARMMEGRYPQLQLLHASMNGLQVSNPAIIMRAKLAGMKNGVPDLFLPVSSSEFAGAPGLFIEMKRKGQLETRYGGLSDDQLWWHKALREQGFRVVTAYGASDAIHIISEHLGIIER